MSTFGTFAPRIAGPSGLVLGSTSGIAPGPGYIGEQITAHAENVSLSNLTAANITQITLTAGVWDVTGYFYVSVTGNSTSVLAGNSLTSATLTGLAGEGYLFVTLTAGTFSRMSLVAPLLRVTTSTNIIVYLVGRADFSTGTAAGNGLITATRVG